MNPEIFQGKFKSKNYFEGWYYKIVSKDEKNSFAFIPGIALTKKEMDTHLFKSLTVSIIERNILSFLFQNFTIQKKHWMS